MTSSRNKKRDMPHSSEVVLKVSGQGYVFWSTAQFADWAHALKLWTEPVAVPGEGRDNEEEKESFNYEKKNIVYDRERGNYTKHPGKRNLHHINLTEHAIPFRRTGTSSERLYKLCYSHIASQSDRVVVNLKCGNRDF